MKILLVHKSNYSVRKNRRKKINEVLKNHGININFTKPN